jgi:hypothetical protein
MILIPNENYKFKKIRFASEYFLTENLWSMDYMLFLHERGPGSNLGLGNWIFLMKIWGAYFSRGPYVLFCEMQLCCIHLKIKDTIYTMYTNFSKFLIFLFSITIMLSISAEFIFLNILMYLRYFEQCPNLILLTFFYGLVIPTLFLFVYVYRIELTTWTCDLTTISLTK